MIYIKYLVFIQLANSWIQAFFLLYNLYNLYEVVYAKLKFRLWNLS